MFQNLYLSLQITLIGMGLIFAAILLLWGVIALIVRFAAAEEEIGDEMIIVTSGGENLDLQKRQAAIAAVAVALARQAASTQPHLFPLPSTPIVSAWQAVLRTRMITKRG